MHVTCEVKTCTCVITATCISFFACLSFFSDLQQLLSILFCLCILDTGYARRGRPRRCLESEERKKGRKHKTKEKLVLGRLEVRMRPECGVQVNKLEEATDQH